jgi:hypothetical protein
VSCFCAEIQLSGKIPKNIAKILFCQKTHGAKRRDEGGLWPGLTTRGRGPALATPTYGGHLGHRLDPSFRLHIPSDLKGAGVQCFFADRLPLRRRHQKPRFGTRNSVLAPCRDGDLEEIFITIITDVSPSTIHDSPIHV